MPPQELKIMDLLAKGYTTNQIAAQLGLMPNTINTHIHRIYKKLHVSNRVQAISAFAAMQNREQNSNLSYAYNSPQNHPNFLQETDSAC